MEFWSMEAMEIMGDAMEEVAEWLAHEADMETHPFDWAGGLPNKENKNKGERTMERISYTYINLYDGVKNTEVWETERTDLWVDYWDAERNGEIKIVLILGTHDGWETYYEIYNEEGWKALFSFAVRL